MRISTIKFNTKNNPEFFKELRERVNKYFEENKITKYANTNMKIKTIFMLSLYFIPLVLMLTGIISSPYPVFFMWVLMGLGMSGIGLSIMHDANHGAYSKHKWVNQSLGFLLNFLGGYHLNWRIQHNVLHHSYTNIDGYDEDINNKLMRFSPHQKRRYMHRFQAFYAPFFYSLMSIYWLVSKDFEQLVRYNKKELLSGQGLTLKKGIKEVIIHKTWYLIIFLVLPLILIEVPWWQTVLGFLTMHFITGLALALIFQPAHVVTETDFYSPDDQNSVENNWAIHQLHTTSNFAHRSILFSWFIGGLNYQIEHHLFPQICHVHYKKISKIVKETATDYGITYHQHKTFLQALWSHFSVLNALGTGAYDKKLIKI
jgi:linoleoyl-CoA desaturase